MNLHLLIKLNCFVSSITEMALLLLEVKHPFVNKALQLNFETLPKNNLFLIKSKRLPTNKKLTK